jgi:hypothetical protein
MSRVDQIYLEKYRVSCMETVKRYALDYEIGYAWICDFFLILPGIMAATEELLLD